MDEIVEYHNLLLICWFIGSLLVLEVFYYIAFCKD